MQALRDLTRTRKQLVGEIARHTLRIQKTLEDANLKLTRVMSDILGTSGRAILRALIAGETDPERLADLTTGRLKATRAQLVEALHGRVTAHHRFLIELHLTQIETLETAVQKLEAAFGGCPRSLSSRRRPPDHHARLERDGRPGLVAEIGTDMTRFPTAGHLVSWAGLCPRLDMSAGKRHSTRFRHATPWLKTTLIQGAWAATHKKDGYLHAQFIRLKKPAPLHAHRCLRHAPRWRGIRGPRWRLLRPPRR